MSKKAEPARIPTYAINTITKIMESPLLFCEEFLRIKDKSGRIVPFRFNKLQRRRCLEVMREYYKPYKTISGNMWRRMTGARYLDLKFRQWGESTMWCGLYFHDTVTNEGTDTIIYCQDASFSMNMMTKHKVFLEYLPEHIKPIVGSNSTSLITFPKLMSSIKSGTPGASESVADKQGRSTTLRNVHMSEFSMWPNPRITLSALEEAVPVEGNMFIEASPNKVGDDYHQMYVAGKKPDAYWKSHFSPWFVFPAYKLKLTPEQEQNIIKTLTEEEIELIAQHNLSPGQIAFRRRKIASKGGNMALFWKEYPEDDEKCFELQGTQVFEDPLRKINCTQRAAKPGHIHQIGADVGAGIEGGDHSAIEVIDFNTQENIYSWQGLIPPDEFALKVYEVWLQYPGLVGIECNSLGVATVAASYRIDDWLNPNPGFLFANNSTYGGFMTTKGNKNKGIYYLKQKLMAENNEEGTGLKLGSKYAHQEMRWFQHLPKKDGTGDSMGAPGTKSESGKLTDDNIMALMIANAIGDWVIDIQDIFYERFGVNTGNVRFR